MDVITEKRAEMIFISLTGRIDNQSAETLEENLSKIITEGARQLIIDCSQIEHINNAGLRVLLNLAKQVLDFDGRIALHSPSQSARAIFDRTGFSLVSRIYETREEAIAGVAGSGVLSASRNDRRFVTK